MIKDIKFNDIRQRLALKISILLMILSIVIILPVMLYTKTPLRANFKSQMTDAEFAVGLTIILLLQMTVPFLAEKVFKVKIAPSISFVFIFNCYGGTFLGNIANLYYIIPYFDKIMHFIGSFNLCMIGVALVQLYNKDRNNEANPLLTAIIVLIFGIAFSTIWEIIEFTIDEFSDMNMQRYAGENGIDFVGRDAVMDTMIDTLFNTAGSIIVAVLTFISIKYKKNWHYYCQIIPIPM